MEGNIKEGKEGEYRGRKSKGMKGNGENRRKKNKGKIPEGNESK